MNGRRIGVYICYCGGNISDCVDVEKVRERISGEPGVAVAKTSTFTCSDAAQEEIIEDIKNESLDGLVVASCSPKLHLFTFRDTAGRAGLNPYQYVQVNLREQCSWTHTDDREGATEKAVRLVRAGIAKAGLTEPLERIHVETVGKVLVVGGGVAGLRAALGLSDLGLGVFLVERSPDAGGWVRKWGTMFPNDRLGYETARELEEEVRRRENITLFTDTEVISKEGSVGDFTVKLKVQNSEVITLEVGAILVATGFEPYQPSQGEFGYGREGVVTLPEFKELVDGVEGTNGTLEHNNGTLKHKEKPVRDVVYIYCVGSRQQKTEDGKSNPYCSRYCCTAAVHTSLSLLEKQGDINQYHLFRDMRTYGKYELLYEKPSLEGAVFARYDESAPPVLEKNGEKLTVKVKDILTGGEELEIEADLVVLVTGMVPRENKELVNILKVPIGKDGFFNEIHPKLRPVETIMDGIYIAGASQGPKNSAESMGSALAAASKGAGLLKKGYVELEPLVAKVDPESCEWCGKCAEACPYDAVEKVSCDGKEVARVTQVQCKGEGACVPVCPQEAIEVEGYTDKQIKAMIDSMVK